ncbi:hypothetical protein AZE42_10976 [Rhizopogon vesiculosus]|uniref:NYN domain-containing protein n=1 Tax=Rhizopogon vesiculosus TaxID=180088 RepID=A0A1J8QT48_9AGAM|nr:hypothetical protein AZE42_10976 [Rhizopogon vesiculosus]
MASLDSTKREGDPHQHSLIPSPNESRMSDHRKVAVFWDYENCSPPLSSQGYAIVSGIRRIAHVFGRVMAFKTYLDMSTQSQSSRSITFRSELQSSGVSMVDCPHNGRKDVVDKMILVDMLAFALDHHDSPATIILITGDRDCAYAMSTLRLRQYTVVLITPSGPNTPQSLQSQASVVIDWNYAILGKCSERDTPLVRQPGPHHDLDEDLIERLTCEIRDSNEDPAVTLLSSSHPTATAPAHTPRATSSDAARPPPTCTPTKAASVFPNATGHYGVVSAVLRAGSTTQSAPAVPDIHPSFSLTENNALSDRGVAVECVSVANEIQDATDDPFARPHIMSPRGDRYQFIAEPDSPPIANFKNFLPSPSPSATFNLRSRTTPLHSHSPSQERTISGETSISFSNLPQSTMPFLMPSLPVSAGVRGDPGGALKSMNADSASGIMRDSILSSDRAALLGALGLSDDEDDYSSGGIANGSSSSPRLTEVDNPSHVYAMNVVESTLHKGQASFHNIARSPPANDASPPVTEHSGTLMSQQSSLSTSFSDPNITMPNVGIRSPQVTSIISDNSDNHSSGYYTPPFETVEDRIRRLTPPQFLPLINQLLLARSKGTMKPTRSEIAIALFWKGNDVYQRAGVTRFREYILQAEQASLVVLGGQESQGEQSWIALHPNLFKEDTTTEPVEETAIESVEDKVRRLTSPQFLPLIEQLLLARSKGTMKPTRSEIAIALFWKGNDVYQRAGVTRFWEYVLQAEQASLVVLGGHENQGEQSWIALHPNWFEEETNAPSSTPSTVHSNGSPALQDNIEGLALTSSTPRPSTAPQATTPHSNTPGWDGGAPPFNSRHNPRICDDEVVEIGG